LEKNLQAWRKAGDDKDHGMPVALKESGHVYKTVASVPRAETQTLFGAHPSRRGDDYPLFSLDLFNCFSPKDQQQVVSLVKAAAEAAAQALPDLNSMHVLQSTDGLTVVLVGAWSSLEGRSALEDVPDYASALAQVKRLANAGTFTDLLEKKRVTGRTFLVATTHLP